MPRCGWSRLTATAVSVARSLPTCTSPPGPSSATEAQFRVKSQLPLNSTSLWPPA
jgi:hypothetical protein